MDEAIFIQVDAAKRIVDGPENPGAGGRTVRGDNIDELVRL